MRTLISEANPFGHDRYGFAWEHVPDGGRAHLDFGCSAGAFLGALEGKRVGRRVGLDASRKAIESARAEHPGIEFAHQTEPRSLPFEDGAFDSITVLDVIEHLHVDDQRALLSELHRVLADEGVLVVTVPRQHVFSVLDLGNLKFRFPRLYRLYHTMRYGEAAYRLRCLACPNGMVGDVSVRKRWHEHFTPQGLGRLLGEAGFQVVQFDGSGLFSRPLLIVRLTLGGFPPARRFVETLREWDARRFESRNLYCVACKKR
jgi:SAM-dependent methyltransferase